MLGWAVVGFLVVVALHWLAGYVDRDVDRRAADDAHSKLDAAVSAISADVAADPNLRGAALAAAVAGRVGEVYRGVVTAASDTGTGARVDAYVDGGASHPGGPFGTELTRRLCVRITVEPAADPQVGVEGIRCTGTAADLPPDTRETQLTRSPAGPPRSR